MAHPFFGGRTHHAVQAFFRRVISASSAVGPPLRLASYWRIERSLVSRRNKAPTTTVISETAIGYQRPQ